MCRYTIRHACPDCGTWSDKPVSPTDCSFCKEMNSGDDAADDAA